MTECLVSSEQMGKLFPGVVRGGNGTATVHSSSYVGNYRRGDLELTVHARTESGVTHLLVLCPTREEWQLDQRRHELFEEFVGQIPRNERLAWYERRGESFVRVEFLEEEAPEKGGGSESDLTIDALRAAIRCADWLEVE